MQEKEKNKAKTAARVLVICAAALIVLAAAAGFIFSRRYVRSVRARSLHGAYGS